MYRGETMKLFQVSWLLGLFAYVILGVFRRSGPLVESISPGMQTLSILLLSLLAGIGVLLGMVSWKRKETNGWLVIAIIVLNAAIALTGFLYLT
jgi:hypothetical protein